MKPLFISATKQDTGKTATTIGLVEALRNMGVDVGYMKPVGQHYIEYNGEMVDEDVEVMHRAFGLEDRPGDMNPVTVPRGFTEKYIFDPNPKPLEIKILAGFERLQKTHELMVVEGTGHAGVGACLDMSNARVAELLNAKTVLITDGGIGKAIDEAILSLNLFDKHRVDVLGVLVNKVWPDKLDRIRRAVKQGFANRSHNLLGALAYYPVLSFPRMKQVIAKLSGTLLCSDNTQNRVDRTLVAAMTAQDAEPYIAENTLIVTGGDRLDTIDLALSPRRVDDKSGGNVSGLILTGGFELPSNLREKAKHSGIPVMLCDEDTWYVASSLRDARYKILPDDTEKIRIAKDLIHESIDVRGLLESLKTDAG